MRLKSKLDTLHFGPSCFVINIFWQPSPTPLKPGRHFLSDIYQAPIGSDVNRLGPQRQAINAPKGAKHIASKRRVCPHAKL